jgi:hypothetical protein
MEYSLLKLFLLSQLKAFSFFCKFCPDLVPLLHERQSIFLEGSVMSLPVARLLELLFVPGLVEMEFVFLDLSIHLADVI